MISYRSALYAIRESEIRGDSRRFVNWEAKDQLHVTVNFDLLWMVDYKFKEINTGIHSLHYP